MAFASSPARVVLFGDSITQQGFMVGGWASRLSDYYVRRADVLNRGLSGYNARWAVPTLKHVFPHGTPVSLATVFFGANDASHETRNARQHVPIEEYKQHLATIIQHIRRSSGAAVLVIAPPPVHAEKYRAWIAGKKGGKLPEDWEADRSMELSGQYAQAALAVAAEEGAKGDGKCFGVDLHSAMSKRPSFGDFLSDGLHLSEQGNELLASLLQETIEKSLPELKVSPCPYTGSTSNSGSASAPTLPPLFPWHDKVDAASPARSFEGLVPGGSAAGAAACHGSAINKKQRTA